MRPWLFALLVSVLTSAPGVAQERGQRADAPQRGQQGRPPKAGGRGKAPERPAPPPAEGATSAVPAAGEGMAPAAPASNAGAAPSRTAGQGERGAAGKPSTPVAPVPAAVPELVTLDSAQALFRTSDADGDGKLDLREAAKAGLGPRDCNAADSDGDRMLAEAEFLAAYVGSLTKQQRRIAPDLHAAVTTSPAAVPASNQPASNPPAVKQQGADQQGARQPGARQPAAKATTSNTAPPAGPSRAAGPVVAAPAPSRPGTAQYELETKIEEALRKNLGDLYVPRPEPPPVDASVATEGSTSNAAAPTEASESEPVERSLEQRAAELREALELRLRESGAGPEEVAVARARLERQLTELAQSASSKPTPGSRRDPTRAPDERDRELRENLEAKLVEDRATPEQAANARARLEARIAEMRAKDAERAAQDAVAEPAEARTFERRAEELRANLELKLAETNAPPAEAEAARARLERQLAELAQGSAPKPPPGSRRDLTRSPDERDRELRESLEAKLKEDNATPEQAANARERLEARIAEMRAKDAERGRTSASAPAPSVPPQEPAPKEPAPVERGTPASAPTPTDAPAPTEDPVEARFRNLREGLERKLAESGATPEEAAAERARLEKRIEGLRREAAGGARPAPGGKKKRDGGG